MECGINDFTLEEVVNVQIVRPDLFSLTKKRCGFRYPYCTGAQ
jgi:hypothetical protein